MGKGMVVMMVQKVKVELEAIAYCTLFFNKLQYIMDFFSKFTVLSLVGDLWVPEG